MTVAGPDPQPRSAPGRPRRRRLAALAALVPAVVCAAAIGGCAAPKKPVPPYVQPTSGPTARFLVRSSVPAGDRYGVYVLEKGETCADPHLVGFGDAQNHPGAARLAADSVQTIEFRLASADKKVCAVRWTFTPMPGKTYLLRALGQQTTCAAMLMDMTDADHMRPEPTALRRNPPGSACLPIASSKAVASRGMNAAMTDDDAVLRQGASASDLEGLIGK